MTRIGLRRIPPLDRIRLTPHLANDFLVSSNTAFSPFLGSAIVSGTVTTPASGLVTGNHPGIVRLQSSALADSGYRIMSDTAQLRFLGNERYDSIFNITSLTELTLRMGFHDTTTVSDATDGCYLEILSTGVATGKTASNSVRSSTGTTTTLSIATWYRASIRLNGDATAVTFSIYDDTGTLVWTDTLSTNIPSASGRECGVGLIASKTNTGLAATDLLHLDYQSFQNTRRLVRGG